MAKFRALMLWTDAWIADTKHLSRCERGTYHDLLVLMWRTPGCSVPNDNEWLAKRLGMTLTEVENELRPLIFEFCQTDGNRIWQKRLLHEFKWSGKRSQTASDNAKRRWEKKKEQCKDDAKQHCSTVTVSVPVTDKKERPSVSTRAKPRVRLPEGWLPEGYLPEQRADFEKFCDHARANGRLCADWAAAWRNWKRKGAELAQPRQNGRTPRPGSWEDRQEKTAHAVAELDQYIARHANEPRPGGDPREADDGVLPFAKPA